MVRFCASKINNSRGVKAESEVLHKLMGVIVQK
jgi:hypothetical protein